MNSKTTGYWITLALVLLTTGCSTSSSPSSYNSNTFEQQNTDQFETYTVIDTSLIQSISPHAENSMYNTSSNTSFFTQHTEYKKNAEDYDIIGVADAWARGATGKDVAIAIIDQGIRIYTEFEGRNVKTIDNASFQTQSFVYDPLITPPGYGHSTSVSALMAGNFDAILKDPASINSTDYASLVNDGMVGIAYEADIVDVPGLYYQELPEDSDFLSEDFSSFAIQAAVNHAKYINMSIGSSTIYSYESYRNDLSSLLTGVYRNSLEALRQSNTPESEQSIFIASTGNAGDAEPIVFNAGLPLVDSSLHGLVLAVGGINTQGTIIFNRCGSAAAWCLVAPSLFLHTLRVSKSGDQFTSSYGSASGTSYSTPIVTGALAIVDDFFNGTISPREVAARILETADASTCKDYVCGQGILDLKAATEPVGALSMALGDTLGGYSSAATQTISFQTSSFSVPEASGNVMMIDELDAPFLVPLSSIVKFSQKSDRLSSAKSNNNRSSLRTTTATSISLSSDQTATSQHSSRIVGDLLTFSYQNAIASSASALTDAYSCGTLCFSDPWTSSNLLGNMVSSTWEQGSFSYKASSCMIDASQDCTGLSSAYTIANLAFSATLIDSNSNHQDEWFGLSTKLNQAGDTTSQSYSQSTQTAFSTEYSLTDLPVKFQLSTIDYRSNISLNAVNSLLESGEIDYAKTSFSILGFWQSEHKKNNWSMTVNHYSNSSPSNKLHFNVPVSRTPDKRIIYSNSEIDLELAQKNTFQMQWGQTHSSRNINQSYGIALFSSLSGSLNNTQISLAYQSQW